MNGSTSKLKVYGVMLGVTLMIAVGIVAIYFGLMMFGWIAAGIVSEHECIASVWTCLPFLGIGVAAGLIAERFVNDS